MIRLTLRSGVGRSIDGSPITADGLARLNVKEVGAIGLLVDDEITPLGDVFDVQRIDSPRGVDLEVIADRSVHHLAAGQRGGVMLVDSDIGDRLANRMRRGTVIVLGDCGDGAASLAIAGTVVVTGQMGEFCGFGMRRGTLVTSASPGAGWSEPTPLRTPFAAVLAKRLPPIASLQPIGEALIGGGAQTRRGDRRVGGQGEWWQCF